MFGSREFRKRFDALDQKLEALSLLVTKGFKNIMGQLEDVIADINTATNNIATALDNEGSGVAAVAAEIAKLRDQLAAAPTVTQATLDALASIDSRLKTTVVTINATTDQLKSIAADPVNPVPAPATPPAPVTPPAA